LLDQRHVHSRSLHSRQPHLRQRSACDVRRAGLGRRTPRLHPSTGIQRRDARRTCGGSVDGAHDHVGTLERGRPPRPEREPRPCLLSPERDDPAATQLVATIRKDGAEPLLFVTWAHQAGWPQADLPDYATMQAAIDQGYLGLAGNLGVPIAPVGETWQSPVRRTPTSGRVMAFTRPWPARTSPPVSSTPPSFTRARWASHIATTCRTPRQQVCNRQPRQPSSATPPPGACPDHVAHGCSGVGRAEPRRKCWEANRDRQLCDRWPRGSTPWLRPSGRVLRRASPAGPERS